MTQELIDLRKSIQEGRYADALVLVDELEGMSRQAVLRNIQSFLLRLLVHLIKNQVEQRLTNSWAASISDSIRQIKKLNLQDHKISYYVKLDEWEEMLEDEFDAAIDAASAEIYDGIYTPFQLLAMVEKTKIILTAQKFLSLTYDNSAKTLPVVIRENLAELSGGEDWKSGRQ